VRASRAFTPSRSLEAESPLAPPVCGCPLAEHGPPVYLQVVGLASGWHAGMVMASGGDAVHGRRICQVCVLEKSLSGEFPHFFL